MGRGGGHDVGGAFQPGDAVARIQDDAEVRVVDGAHDVHEVVGGDLFVGLQAEGDAGGRVAGHGLLQEGHRLGGAGPVAGRVEHGADQGHAQLARRVEVLQQVPGADAPGAQFQGQAEVAGGGPEVGEFRAVTGLDGRVVADLEDLAAQFRRVAEHVRQGHRLGCPGRDAPEVRVGADAVRHHATAAGVVAGERISSRIASTFAGSWAKRPRKRPSTVPARRVSRPGPALPP